MTDKHYNIFISYRRKGGDMLANLLYTRLKADGYAPFFDIETLRSGKFNEQLYERIAECNDFIIVLPPRALERCMHDDDWVRLEIAKALQLRKNIIPILMKGFVFPDNLPEDISEIRLYHGITANSEYFDATYDRLKKLLISLQSNIHLDMEQKAELNYFPKLLNSVYDSLVGFREALREGDQNRYNVALSSLQQVMQKLFLYSEKNQYLEPVFSERAKRILCVFNQFVDDYNKFSSFPPVTRMSSEAQQYALIAEKSFNDLLLLVIKSLSEITKTCDD
ncbi:MAG: toll/interleukin-1 receptor domain-containing protein [Clostridia bacterium]|nr:toll/interleukin-1 receptor domain-containing protein [Clostridia bacterium]